MHNERQVKQAATAIEAWVEMYEDIPERIVRVTITTDYNRLEARTVPDIPEDPDTS